MPIAQPDGTERSVADDFEGCVGAERTWRSGSVVRGGRIPQGCLSEKRDDSLLWEPPTRSWLSSTVTEGMPYTLMVSRGGC